MYKLKNAIRRGTAFMAAVGLLGAMGTSMLPAMASADALNPLTERSLKLSSSSPGYHYLDGSGNALYAPPGSGPNGQKTAETFAFKNSTDSTSSPTVKAFTFQYCTTPAGDCTAPGDGTGTNESNLNIVYGSPVDGTDFTVNVGGTPSTGWTMTPSRELDHAGSTTSEDNFITLTNSTGINPAAGTQFVITFNASSSQYITNPGSGAFFVKINDFDSDTNDDPFANPSDIVDGGVTVANVMNDSIQIQTKVLETMSFSVGTVNPDTIHGAHGTCDAVATNNPINLGDPNAENSLSTTQAYDGISYFRLSSNSSNGATVYYSGYTLSNTENNQITAAYDLTGGHTAGDGSATISHPGTEQFGLALLPTNSTADPDANPDSLASTGSLSPLLPETGYGNGDGTITSGGTAQFAFKNASITSPEPIASENTAVVHCTTGKVRYVANIAPDTPAGIYTSKVNYIASPEY